MKVAKRTISLNGEWIFEGVSPDGSERIKLKAVVLGFVHVDLLNEGMIKDPFWRDQANGCQWVENWYWTYL